MAVANLDQKVVEVLPAEAIPQEESQLYLITKRFLRHKMATVSVLLLIVVFASSLLAKQIAPFGPTEISLGSVFATPGQPASDGLRTHWLGTDHLGRDFFSRILYAARISLTIAFVTVIGSVVIGAVFGAVSGYYGGFIDDVAMRFVEFLLTIPELPILLVLSSILIQKPDALPVPQVILNATASFMYIAPREAQQVVMVSVVLMSFGWLGIARLMRGMALSIKTQEFVEASRALGVSDVNIILRHLIPNAFAPIIVAASLALAGYVITEAVLSFIGFGIQDPTPTWGNMLAFTESYMFQHPWLPLIPGIPMFVCALAFNFVGDGLRDALDPRLKR
jgi:peptide/nickel transport system permease protein